MTLEEMKLAVCEKLPELVCINPTNKMIHWQLNESLKIWHEEVRWPTEGLQVCHEAEKLLSTKGGQIGNPCEKDKYCIILNGITKHNVTTHSYLIIHSTYEQRLEALCRVWYPEKFN